MLILELAERSVRPLGWVHMQKRARPHGTNANSCDGSTKHTLQLSSSASAAAADEAGL